MIDADSPAGSYRAALNPAATCAACHQSVCQHSDLVFAGLVPAPTPARPPVDPDARVTRHRGDLLGPPGTAPVALSDLAQSHAGAASHA